MIQVKSRLFLYIVLLSAIFTEHELAAQTTVGEPQIVVRLPVARSTEGGNLVMQPNVSIEGSSAGLNLQQYRYRESSSAPVNYNYEENEPDKVFSLRDRLSFSSLGFESNGFEVFEDFDGVDGYLEPVFDKCKPVASYICNEFRGGSDCPECSPLKRMFGFEVHRNSFDKGIGLKRVPLALMEMDITQPLNNYRARIVSNYGTYAPDRAEFLWKGSTFGGPEPESSLDWQELRIVAETGSESFSLFTEYPLRMLDPELNGNTAGFGDMQVGNKLVLIDGKDWQVTQIFRTQFQTGASSKGLGTGYVRMEPGLLGRFRWTDRTYLHYELKYNFAIAGSPEFSGQVLRYGFGISHLLHETDTFAMMPTLEFVGWNVMDGLQSVPGGIPVEVDGASFLSILPGARFVLGPAGDLGLFELGVAGGFNTSNNGFYDKQLQIDLRFSY